METKYLALQTTVTVRRAWPVPTTPSSPSTTTTCCPPPTTTTPSLSRTTLPCPQWRPRPVTPPGLRTWSTSLPRLPGPAGTPTTSRHLLQHSPLQWRLSWLSQVSEASRFRTIHPLHFPQLFQSEDYESSTKYSAARDLDESISRQKKVEDEDSGGRQENTPEKKDSANSTAKERTIVALKWTLLFI